jgi:Phage integrase family
MIFLAYRHGLRAAEVVDLRWADGDAARAEGQERHHPLTGREMRELRQHQRESLQSPFIFVAGRGSPLSAPGFSRMVERAGVVADLGIKVHAHMLRHSTGYNDALIDAAVEYGRPLELPPHERIAAAVAIALDPSMSFSTISSSCCARRSRVGSAAFVGRRGVEWRATVRISVVGVTSARCAFVIDLWAFPRATVQ